MLRVEMGIRGKFACTISMFLFMILIQLKFNNNKNYYTNNLCISPHLPKEKKQISVGNLLISHKYPAHSLHMKKPTFPLKRFDSWKLRRVDKHPKTSQFHRISACLCKLATSSSQLYSFQQAHCMHNSKKLSLIHATETLHSFNKIEKTQKLGISSLFFF